MNITSINKELDKLLNDLNFEGVLGEIGLGEIVDSQPDIDSSAIAQELFRSNAIRELVATFMPLIDSLENKSSMNPLELLNAAFVLIQSLVDPLDQLKKLVDMPVIGELAKIVHNILSIVVKLFTIYFTIKLMMMKGVPFGYDDTVEMFKNIDMSEFKEQLQNLKKELRTAKKSNNHLLEFSNEFGIVLSETAMNEFSAMVQVWESMTLDDFIKNKAKDIIEMAGLNVQSFETGLNPYYLKMNVMRLIYNKLNEAVIKMIRKSKITSKADYMARKLKNSVDKKVDKTVNKLNDKISDSIGSDLK